MFLPHRLLAKELHRRNCWKNFLKYQKAHGKHRKNSLRIKFLEKCKQSDIIPRFLRRRIPTNGCFDDKTVREFQHKLLRKEIIKAKSDQSTKWEQFVQTWNAVEAALPQLLWPSISLYVHINTNTMTRQQNLVHNKKLAA